MAHDADFLVGNLGSMVALTPMTPKAMGACGDGTIGFEPWQMLGGSIMVDPCVAADLLDNLCGHGFIIENESSQLSANQEEASNA